MDWFERLTGLDPDGGGGSFESLLVTAAAVAVLAVITFAMRRVRLR